MEPHLSILSADICYRPHKYLPYIENLDAWLSDIVTPFNGSLGVRGGDWFGSLRPFWTPSNFPFGQQHRQLLALLRRNNMIGGAICIYGLDYRSL